MHHVGQLELRRGSRGQGWSRCCSFGYTKLDPQQIWSGLVLSIERNETLRLGRRLAIPKDDRYDLAVD